MTISSRLAAEQHTAAFLDEDLLRRRTAALTPMGSRGYDKLKLTERMNARERIDYLLDEGSFVEFDALAHHRTTAFGMEAKRPVTDGIIIGWGTIGGREVCTFSQDGTILGGALGEVYGEKMIKIQELAITTGRLLIGMYEGAGARIQDGAVSLGFITQTFHHNVRASGVTPQISAIFGACTGGNVYSPALTDFVVMVEESSRMFVIGPDIIETVTGEKTSQYELGGTGTHMEIVGNSHYAVTSEQNGLDWVCDLLGYLPNNTTSPAPSWASDASDEITGTDRTLDSLIPDSPSTPYDVHEAIYALCDDAEFLEIQENRAANVVIGLDHLNGQSVGFAANQPMEFAGCLDIDAAGKTARFVRACDCFNILLVFLVDVPGFLSGSNQEHQGTLRRGAKLLYAYVEAIIPRITVTMRKAYGGAYCVMGSKGLDADVNLAWPTAQIAVMGASGAIRLFHRDEIRTATEAVLIANPAADRFGTPESVKELITKLEMGYEQHMLTPYRAAERGLIDEIILPSET